MSTDGRIGPANVRRSGESMGGSASRIIFSLNSTFNSGREISSVIERSVLEYLEYVLDKMESSSLTSRLAKESCVTFWRSRAGAPLLMSSMMSLSRCTHVWRLSLKVEIPAFAMSTLVFISAVMNLEEPGTTSFFLFFFAASMAHRVELMADLPAAGVNVVDKVLCRSEKDEVVGYVCKEMQMRKPSR